ncbi:protein phosphatase 2C domain-containing protein [Nocardioides convexus]|uniref:PP2C family protein-serine/threonine phosphatase n=1 Tax=Nocardioides convexus TaxID=2712224 RepID=UPI002418A4FB|nr:protein phosphatase 2C domain-containing protein [Nocardioides convexus]
MRAANEDSYLADPPVFVVADGMGGHDRGDVASAIVVEEFARLASEGYDAEHGAEVVATTLHAVQERILAFDVEQRANGADADFSAGTTAVIALLVDSVSGPVWLLANVGDSRIYRFNEGEPGAGQRRPQPGPGDSSTRARSARPRRPSTPTAT